MTGFKNKIGKVHFFKQFDEMDCGPSCLKMVCSYYGKDIGIDYLRKQSFVNREGVSLLDINDAAEELGFRTLMVKLTYEKLKECPTPCILHWNQNHYVVLVKSQNSGMLNALLAKKTKNKFTVADPSEGIIQISKENFIENWISTTDGKGVALLLDPTNDFFSKRIEQEKESSFKFLFSYFRPHKKLALQLLFGLVILSVSAIGFPFLMKLLVDVGIKFHNFSLVVLVLLSQLFLFTGTTAINFIRNWITLHISARISLNIISDFLIKLLKLPLSFFDSKSVGDLAQRINDHHRIESFLTVTTVDSVFSLFNIFFFSIVLGLFSIKILCVFIFASALGIGWILLFQKKRKQLDYIRFQRNKQSQDKLYEFIVGMHEIKLNGSETYKRWDWERQQIKLFKLNIQSLSLEQYQKIGYIFFTNLKNILVSFIAALETINGTMTLGTMLSISFIIGQTNGPLEQLINLVLSSQDAIISMDRLNEIQNKKSEEELISSINDNDLRLKDVASHVKINIRDLSFQYGSKKSPFILKNINLEIPKGKITAIVGSSGSGKTTLLKLILGFYLPTKGEILIGNQNLNSLSPKLWRQKCGTVLQDGYIFSDSITRNIASDGQEINVDKFQEALKISNVDEFISNFPLKYNTKIGTSGIGISGGQKQRILISRAIYKNPYYIFLDEATSSLDANNEKLIMENLNNFFVGRTVVIIAHRLSTVKNADQIIVLEKGEVVELGNHDSLISNKGKYYELVKNQLEI